jgi:hypothetical protein
MRSLFKTAVAHEQPVVEEKTRPDDKEGGLATEQPPSSGEKDSDVDSIDKDAQVGVQNIEAITKVWTTRDLYLAYVLYAH